MKAGDERLLEVLLWDALLRGADRAGAAPLTQEELAERTGLSRNSIKAYTSTKLKRVLDGDGSPSLLPGAGHAIGVDFGGTHEVRVVLTNLWGDQSRMSRPADELPRDRPEAWRTVETAVEEIWKAMTQREDPVGPEQLVGVGIGIPTPSVPRKSTEDPAFGHWKRWGDPGTLLRSALNKKWEEEDLGNGAWSAVRFASENDTNLSAVSDHLWGGGPSSDFTLFVKWQASVRAALILDGELYTGCAGFAGELPHVKVEGFETLAGVEGGRKRCGWADCPAGEGCVYAIAPIEKLVTIGEETAGLEVPDPHRAEAIVEQASENEALLQLLYIAAEGIGKAIAPLALGVSPEQVVIGGALGARAYPLVLDRLRKGVEDQTKAADFLVTNSTIRNRGTVLGAAALALLKFGPEYLKRLASSPPAAGAEASRSSAARRRRTAAPA